MDKIQRLLEQIHDDEWSVDGKKIIIPSGNRARKQIVYVQREQEHYVFVTTVLGTRAVTKDATWWRELARLAWQRNAEQQLVTFAFDKRDRLVGVIRHPVEHLDAAELELYIRTLARECDRFEYLLSGRDRY